MTTKKQQKQSQFKFRPTKELLEFAEYISKNFKKLKVNDYYSANKNYHVQVLPTIINERFNEEEKTPYRVGHESGVMQFSMKKTKDCCGNYFYYAVLWCQCKRELIFYNDEQDDEFSYILADKLTLEQYKKSGRQLNCVITSMIKFFKTNLEFNKNRIIYLIESSNKK